MATKKSAEYSRYVRAFLNDTCCGEPMQSGYDVVDEAVGIAYFRTCNVCSDMEVRSAKALREDFEAEKAHGATF